MYQASCHCGNIELVVEQLPESVTSCNCSICVRLGARWAYYQPDEVTTKFRELPSVTYAWGDRYLDFHHCPTCGCSTHYTSTEKCETARVAINSRLFDQSSMDNIIERKFDGAESWEYID